jgi:hypothetical protein
MLAPAPTKPLKSVGTSLLLNLEHHSSLLCLSYLEAFELARCTAVAKAWALPSHYTLWHAHCASIGLVAPKSNPAASTKPVTSANSKSTPSPAAIEAQRYYQLYCTAATHNRVALIPFPAATAWLISQYSVAHGRTQFRLFRVLTDPYGVTGAHHQIACLLALLSASPDFPTATQSLDCSQAWVQVGIDDSQHHRTMRLSELCHHMISCFPDSAAEKEPEPQNLKPLTQKQAFALEQHRRFARLLKSLSLPSWPMVTGWKELGVRFLGISAAQPHPPRLFEAFIFLNRLHHSYSRGSRELLTGLFEFNDPRTVQWGKSAANPQPNALSSKQQTSAATTTAAAPAVGAGGTNSERFEQALLTADTWSWCEAQEKDPTLLKMKPVRLINWAPCDWCPDFFVRLLCLSVCLSGSSFVVSLCLTD